MATSTGGDEWVTVSEVKRELKVRSNTTVWDWVHKGLLPKPHHIRRRAVWPRREIDAAKRKLIRPPEVA